MQTLKIKKAKNMQLCKYLGKIGKRITKRKILWGKHPSSVSGKAIILFPCLSSNFLSCGLTSIVYLKNSFSKEDNFKMPAFSKQMAFISENNYDLCTNKKLPFSSHYLGNIKAVNDLVKSIQSLKEIDAFYTIFNSGTLQNQLIDLSEQLAHLIQQEAENFYQNMGHLSAEDIETISERIDKLKDASWCVDSDIIENINKIKLIAPSDTNAISKNSLLTFKNINAALNSIDRLEVRGRDSAGISLLFIVSKQNFKDFKKDLENKNLSTQFLQRLNQTVLLNNSISVNEEKDPDAENNVAITMTYKIAAEIGHLGDNVKFIRRQISEDKIFQSLIRLPHQYQTLSAHTRWASVGEINEANCHPVDNKLRDNKSDSKKIIHVCLNGDIDNFQELKETYEDQGIHIPEEITCDTKIIPIHIEAYINKGKSIEEAFRLAVNDFEGSHAISMHTDLAPGKLFLALKGSGQAIFIGLAENHYIAASEIYGLVEETSRFIKMDGEFLNPNPSGQNTRGQIFILNQLSPGGVEGITAMSYDGSPISIEEHHIKETPLTSRDIDRQEFDHYFLKEISESPSSVRKTLESRWKIIGTGDQQKYVPSLNNTIVTDDLKDALISGKIKRIIFIGQGTAGVAAIACADIMRFYMQDTGILVESLKSSELSGFIIDDDTETLSDLLLIPISQSGTTADTNRTVDMVKNRGAYSIAIVNRRDSDLSFKVDGVLYTSSGRDIEMSVASTKAFYSQIIAGAILGLYFSMITNARNSAFISNEIKQMLELPGHMEQVLSLKDQINLSATKHAISRTYWAAVGSGPNKAAADEIRIKLSELCYKTISSDYVEDKKHIDLSSEPLIFVCAAGTKRNVLNDIIKDTAIFHSHKALPIVIADEHEDRFTPYAEDIIFVPSVSENFAPILNTLVGHLWGYYAALSINEGSKFLYVFKKELQTTINQYAAEGLDIYEIALEKSFREKIVRFYHEFRKRQAENRLSATMGVSTSTNLILLLQYLGGRLPLTEFELDFGIKGTATNMFNKLFESLSEAINSLARPVDAIKHQAKTVTVGTSRIEEKTEGILFDILNDRHFTTSQLTISNIMVIRNLQAIISKIRGITLYRVSGINLLGEPTEDTTIEVIEKTGSSAAISSRAEKENRLKGTKRIIVRQGNVYIGKGRKDERSILIIPLTSNDPSRPNTIEFLLLLEIEFKENISLATKVKALGGKHEHIKNLVQENNIIWEDKFLELVDMTELFGRSAEKIAESIIAKID
jgi:glucosamine--fructose-6-phosphate aminotransferase (isomerizing)